MFKIRSKILAFLESKREYPVIAAVASGLYPFLFYYNSNYTMANSWAQLGFFLLCYILTPVVAIVAVDFLSKKKYKGKKHVKYVIPILNLTFFSVFLIISTYGVKTKIILTAIVIAVLIAILVHKHFKKIIVFQYLLAFFVLVKLVPDLYHAISYSAKWAEQPDTIENVVFTKKPNIYIIQPDGYANFSKLSKAPYNFDNDAFEGFLQSKNFKLYHDFRSNYVSTLSSNSSMFVMKHHYYNNSAKLNEVYYTRETIVGKNPVISTFKNNNYKSFLLLECPYLLVNRPKLYYDYCNIDYSEVSYLSRGFEIKKDVVSDLENLISKNKGTNNFYFIEIMKPSHITVNQSQSLGVDKERELYLSKLKKSNETLKEVVEIISENDDNGLIVIVADHGGYVGLNYSLESRTKQTDTDLINSIYTSALAIKWPNDIPVYDGKLKTPVNLFRILFSYLSEDEGYLQYLQEDKSYAIVNRGAEVGVYEYINENGDVIFNKYEAR